MGHVYPIDLTTAHAASLGGMNNPALVLDAPQVRLLPLRLIGSVPSFCCMKLPCLCSKKLLHCEGDVVAPAGQAGSAPAGVLLHDDAILLLHHSGQHKPVVLQAQAPVSPLAIPPSPHESPYHVV